jgi:Na+/H+ antiporter NhaC
MPDWLSILPPILAIAVAVWRKEVVLALTTGIWFGEILVVVDGSEFTAPTSFLGWLIALPQLIGLGFVGMLDRIAGVFASAGNTRVLLFGLLVGILIEWMQRSGGVSAFVRWLAGVGLTQSKRQVSWLASLVGLSIFVETSMSCLASGVVSQKLFDKFRMSRERLAYIIDSTCAPVSVLAVFNGWGAYILGLLEEYVPETETAPTFLASIPYNFYPILILLTVFYTATTTRVFGPLRQVEERAKDLPQSESQDLEPAGKLMFFLVPLGLLVGGMFFFMWFTGGGHLLQGSGSKSVLYSVSLALFVLLVLLLVQRSFEYKSLVEHAYVGIAKLTPVVTIMLLSFAIGTTCRTLETGPFVAGIVGDFLPAVMIAPLLFLAAAVMSFTTGTSWGTFAIMVPVGVPLAMALGIPIPLVLAAILGGGVFGDHCSPISDTTIIASLAAGCDHLEHVRTQLPYAVTMGSITIVLYILVGLVVI